MENISELTASIDTAIKKFAETIKTDGEEALKVIKNDLASIYNRATAFLDEGKMTAGETDLVTKQKAYVKDLKSSFGDSSVEDLGGENKTELLAPGYPNTPTPTAPSPNVVNSFMPANSAGDLPPEATMIGLSNKVVNTAPKGTEAYAAGERTIARLRGESPEDAQAAYDRNVPEPVKAADPNDNRLRDHYTGLSPNTDAVSSQVNPGGAPTMVIGQSGQEAAQADGLQLQPTETGDREIPEGVSLEEATEEQKNKSLWSQIELDHPDASQEEKQDLFDSELAARKDLEEKGSLSKADQLPNATGSGSTENTKENVLKTEGLEGEAIVVEEGLRGTGGEGVRNENTESEKGPFPAT